MTREIANRPARAGSSGLSDVLVLETVSLWTSATSGRTDLSEMLQLMCDRLGVDIAWISRINRLRPSAQCSTIKSESTALTSETRRSGQISVALPICGKYLQTAKPGSVWRGRIDTLPLDAATREALAAQHIAEGLVIPLAQHSTALDFLEMGFRHPLDEHQLDQLVLLGPVLAQIWQKRNVGCFLTSVLRLGRRDKAGPRRSKEDAAAARPVLSVENPYRLSRAEFRVCLLMSKGMTRVNLIHSLGITPSTLRTHLRNIYAKTDTHSEADLLRVLMMIDRKPGAGSAHVA